jgi:hypothetical protein
MRAPSKTTRPRLTAPARQIAVLALGVALNLSMPRGGRRGVQNVQAV